MSSIKESNSYTQEKSKQKQLTLFLKNEAPTLPELDFKKAETLANKIKAIMSIHCDKIEIAGSIRRQSAKVHDIDFVVVSNSDSQWRLIGEELKRLKAKPGCQGNAVIKAYVPCENAFFQVDFYRAQPSTFGIHLLVRTGSADHNMWLAGQAFSKGMRLKYSQGLLKDDVPVVGADEAGVFAALGLPCPAPCDREIVYGNPKWMHNVGESV
jgi:DNA polymerase/3'-5' exonuclease PolX